MKKLITIALSLLLTNGLVAQTYLTQAKPANKKEWGYMNEKGGWIIEPKYRKCTREGYFGYNIYISQLHPKQLQSTLRKIKSNYIFVQDSQLCNFHLKNFIIF